MIPDRETISGRKLIRTRMIEPPGKQTRKCEPEKRFEGRNYGTW